MLKSRYRLCELFGIPIYVDMSFAVLLFMFIASESSLTFGIATAMVLAISVVLHELGHSLVARMFGFSTNDITISLLGGCASLVALPKRPWQELLTALAGPMVSFFLAGCVYLIDVLDIRIYNDWLRAILQYLFWMNVMLGMFNLLPGFPMDGGRIFRSFMRIFMSRAKATYVAMWVGRVFAVLLGIKGLLALFGGGGFAVVTILIAWMIWREGYREYILAREEDDFRKWSQDDFNARVSPPPYDR